MALFSHYNNIASSTNGKASTDTVKRLLFDILSNQSDNIKLTIDARKRYEQISYQMNANLSNYRPNHKPKSGYRYIWDNPDKGADTTCLNIAARYLTYAIIDSIVRNAWDEPCIKTLEMYLDTRYEFIDRYKDQKAIGFLVNQEFDYIKSNAFDILKDTLTARVDEAKADRSLVNEMLSDDSIARSMNSILLADKAAASQYAENINTMIDDFITKSMKQPQTEEEPDTEEADSDPFPEENVIDINFPAMLAKYDMAAIDSSIIQYYQAIQQLTDELMDKLDNCEQKMAPLIRDFNQISLRLSKKYEDNPHLTDKENALLSERQLYFQKKFSLGLSNAKSKILAVRKQADSLESRIDEIDNGDDSIHELALLEKEERASFSFVAENMAKIIKNALQKMDYFQNNRQFITNVIGLWETWSEDYRIFKTTYREDLKATCEEDGIEEDIWGKWYVDWQNIRFAIEQKLKPMIERGLKAPVPAVTETEVSIPEQSIRILNDYKHMVDTFFIEDRKGIYQKFAFQPGGEMQDKFETENELYKYTVSLQGALQEVIFNCENAEDRVFILTWANSLLDIQIDGILDFIADKDLKQLSETLLSEFAALKQKNYDTYLTDAQAYSKERSRREKEYNSLVFKMRKDLMKEWTKR